MNSEERFYLIQRLEKKLEIKFTDLQLDFLMDERGQIVFMPRQSGKDLILKVKIALSAIEHYLHDSPYRLGLIYPNRVASSELNEDIELLIRMMLPPHLSYIKIETQQVTRNRIALRVGNVIIDIRGKTRSIYTLPSSTMVDMVGARFNEIYINEFCENIRITKDLIDRCLCCTLEHIEGKVCVVGTPTLSVTAENIKNHYSRTFTFKKANNLQPETFRTIDVAEVTIDGSVINGVSSINIGNTNTDITRQENGDAWFNPVSSSPTISFNNAELETYTFRGIISNNTEPINLSETVEVRGEPGIRGERGIRSSDLFGF